jgi:hypothetical protein
MANIKELIQSIEAADSSFDEKLAAINQMEETLVAMRQQEETAVQENVDLIVEAIKVMEDKVNAQLEIAKSIVPEKGDKGDKGLDGKQGKDGRDGKDGKDGINGKDGADGKDGVSVTDAKIDFDGSLIISLSTGQEINVGEVVAPELQEKIKLVTSGGAGTVLPSQTGNANKYLKTDGTVLSWAAGDGTGTVTSIGGTGTVNGITLTGTVTSSGNLTLGGTLGSIGNSQLTNSSITFGSTAQALGSTVSGLTGVTIDNGAIGATTASTGKFTTLISTGTATLANGSTTYVQAIGDASYPGVYAAGGTNTPLVLQPLGTGALQAQKTDSSATGGNARGANAVDWQTSRSNAVHVASGAYSVVGGGNSNRATNQYAFSGGGNNNLNSGYIATLTGGNSQTTSGTYSTVVGGFSNNANSDYSTVVSGQSNTAQGYYNFIGAGFTNSGTASAAVTTQSGTMNATTAVTLSGSNANIKVGQYITGTSIAGDTYVSAISGTSLTLSKNASGSSTSTLSFYTPHGVVVGGGNNQATGSYSFIGGGGDAGTAANRNVASGDWSFVGGGAKNTASGLGAVVGGGGYNNNTVILGNSASNAGAFVGSGWSNSASGIGTFVGGGAFNSATASYGSVLGGRWGTDRGISGYMAFSACVNAIASSLGVSQSGLLVLGKETTNATATVITSDGGAASGLNQVILPNNSAYYFRGEVVAGVTGAGDTKGWYIEGVIKRGAGVGTTALVGTPTVSSLYADVGAATWAVTATADTTNGGLKITVTGQASTTIRWVAQIRTTEMTY